MASSPEEMARSMIENLPGKTGKSLPEWLTLLKARGLSTHKDMMAFLKADQGVTHGYANLIAQMARREAEGGPAPAQGLVSAQYDGAKASLRPIYERVIAEVTAFGDDVEIAPKKAYVSLRRKKQFGLIQPSTRTRVDIGINLKGQDPAGRLEASGSFNAMVSHRVRLENVDEVDPDVIAWLRKAYDAAG